MDSASPARPNTDLPPEPPATPRKPRHRLLRVLWFFFRLGVFFALLGVLALYITYRIMEPDLPKVESIRQYKLTVPLRVYSADGKLMATFGTRKRMPVGIDEMPEHLKNAFIAGEDANFYSHPGFDIKGISRAVWEIITTGHKKSGGSTITQQLTRNVFLTLDQTFSRKLKELFLAIKLENTISKDEILELYLNKIFLGHRAYGVAAAADVYYGKQLAELTLPEAAMLAALPKAPSRINPVTSPERALQRRNYVLSRMFKLGMISEDQYQQAIATPDTAFVHEPAVELSAPWVAEMVRDALIKRFGDAAYTDGYVVRTTILSPLQSAAEQALRNGLHAYDERHGWRGAVQHFDLEQPEQAQKARETLENLPAPGGLQGALVTQVDKASALLQLADGQDVEITLDDSQWAAAYEDNDHKGKKPESMSDILNPGDIVMLRRNAEGRFVLAQVPQVQGALSSLDPDTGAIRALVGGYDFRLSKFNRATQAKRQPGSGFKPLIYSAALDAGLTPATLINDAPVVFEDDKLERVWRPENYSQKFYGPTRLREGLVNSRNLVSIRVLDQIGIRYGRKHVLKFGFDPADVPADLSLALGSATVPPLAMSRAFAAFANGGFLIEPYLIERIEDSDGQVIEYHQPLVACENCPPERPQEQEDVPEESTEGSTEPDQPTADTAEAEDTPEKAPRPAQPPEPKRAPRIISAANQFIIESFMQDVIKRGTGRKAMSLGRNDLAGKTGTANEQRDAWFNGYQRHLVSNVWVGFDTPTPLGRGEVGGRAALPIWIEYMKTALKNQPEWKRPIPPGVVTAWIDKTTGTLSDSANPNAMLEYFMAGHLPPAADESGESGNLSRQSEELDNEETLDDLF